MQAITNLPQTAPAGHHRPALFFARTTRTLRCTLTKKIIPAGTVGRIVAIRHGRLLHIVFPGLATVIYEPGDGDRIEIISPALASSFRNGRKRYLGGAS